MKKYEYFFSHSRSALKFYFDKILDKNQTYEILIPDYICETVPSTLKLIKNLKIKYYKINLNLRIDWSDIVNQLNKNTKFFLIVNYFGIPNDLIDAVNFCKEKNLLLIEDNTHGFNGYLNNTKLGHFGDIGISSPRKHIPLNYGGVLYSNIHLNFPDKVLYKTNFIQKVKFIINNNFVIIKNKLINVYRSPINEITHSFEKPIEISALDLYSKNKIKNQNWNLNRKKKFKSFKLWESFAEKHRLKPLININDYKESNPWAFPVLLKDKNELISWLNWSKKKNIISFNWPTLHSDISQSSHAFFLSERVLCFSTYTNLEDV